MSRGDSGWTEAGRPAACPWPVAGQPLHDVPDLETRYLRNFRIHMRAVSTKFQVLSSWRSTGLAQPDPSRAIYHSYYLSGDASQTRGAPPAL